MNKHDSIVAAAAGTPERKAAEEQALAVLAAAVPAAPERARMLAAAYAANDNEKETTMNLFHQTFTARQPWLRLGFALALAAAVLALSILLPSRWGRPPGIEPAYAATDGYLLVFTWEDKQIEDVQPLIDQLLAKVKEFKSAHGLETGNFAFDAAGSKPGAEQGQPQHFCRIKIDKEVQKTGGTEEKTSSKLAVAVALPSVELIDELKQELAAIPGLPEPEVREATWFQKSGEGLPGEDAHGITIGLGDKQHTFNFPKDATPEEMKQALLDWLGEKEPGVKFDIEVVKNKTAEGQVTLMIKIRKAAVEEGAG